MQILAKGRRLRKANHEPFSLPFFGWYGKSLLVLSLAGTLMLSACGGGTSAVPQGPVSMLGNWQFTVANPSDNSFLGGLQGGFLLQKDNTVTGAAVYSVSLPPATQGASPTVCNSGSASLTGTANGPNVALTAVAGTQTFTFTGTLSSDGSMVSGFYTSTVGTAADGSPCGTAQTGLQWSATSVPLLTGAIQGSFHSTRTNRDFPVTGVLVQGPNIGASNATVTGNLTFVDPTTLVSGYPCLDTASVNGQISGNSVILQLIGNDGLNAGQIGGSADSGVSPVLFASTQAGNILHSVAGAAYAVNTKACPGVGLGNPGDTGNICLALASATACAQPITVSPSFLNFPPQLLGSTSTTQKITITNSDPSGTTLSGLQLSWDLNNGSFGAPSDFNGLPNFKEQDTCAPSIGETFTLVAGQSCSVSVSFSPQQSCPWLPFGDLPYLFGAPPARCPIPLTVRLSVHSPASADNDKDFAILVTGTGVSAIQPSTPELDFGAEAIAQASLPQLLSFTNQGEHAVQILHSVPCVNQGNHLTLPHPLVDDGTVGGVRVVSNDVSSIAPDGSTIDYRCDSDPNTLQPNFQISSDTCSGKLLPPQNTCSLQVAFVPQPGTNLAPGLDYFLELSTLQCSSIDSVTSNCEIDSGRFPVELRSNPPSPLRMSPGAGLDFGNLAVGSGSVQQTITLLNDPTIPNAASVKLTGNVVKGDYSETDDCPALLAPGGVCTLTITFKPKVVGFDPGTITITYSPTQTQTVYLRGTGQ